MTGKTSKEQFNSSAEKYLQNRISGYKLNEKERADIWQLVAKRNELIKGQNEYYEANKEKLEKEEYDKLRGAQSPVPQLNYDSRSQPNNALLRRRAYENVLGAHNSAKNEINRNIDKQIDHILNSTRDNGRGPTPNLNNDFNRARDTDRDLDR